MFWTHEEAEVRILPMVMSRVARTWDKAARAKTRARVLNEGDGAFHLGTEHDHHGPVGHSAGAISAGQASPAGAWTLGATRPSFAQPRRGRAWWRQRPERAPGPGAGATRWTASGRSRWPGPAQVQQEGKRPSVPITRAASARPRRNNAGWPHSRAAKVAFSGPRYVTSLAPTKSAALMPLPPVK